MAIVPQCSPCHNYIVNLPAEFQTALAGLEEGQQAAVLAGLCANCRDNVENIAVNGTDPEPPKMFLHVLHLR